MKKHCLVTVSLISLMAFSPAHPWVAALNYFTAGFSLFAHALSFLPPSRAYLIKSYREGRHAPFWFDVLTYGSVVAVAVATGQRGLAIVWCAIAAIDFNHRTTAAQS